MNHKKFSRHILSQSTRQQVFQLAAMPAMLAAAVGCANSAWAVQGGVVAAGSGTISTKGNQTTISQSSDKMVVNWKNFDIARKESVTINQPSATSAVLNRVTTAAPTQIDGSLTANGRVFVVNPAGVMFGKTAKVDVGSLVASSLNVDDSQFMDGGAVDGTGSRVQRALNLYGDGTQGDVSSEGHLNAREAVVLLGTKAVNRGTIRAKDVTLGAADGVAMQMSDSGFAVMLGRESYNALVANHGVISAHGGDVKLSAAAVGAMLGTVVRNTGTLEATQATSGAGGSVVLGSQYDGSISAGGRITADQNISVVSSPVVHVDSPFDVTARPRELFYGSADHHITVASGAKLKARGSVDIATEGGNVAMNGRIEGGDVGISAFGGSVTATGPINGRTVSVEGAGVAINAPVNAWGSVFVAADHSSPGDLIQNANVKSTTGSINLSGHNIVQASGVKTVAGNAVTMTANSPGGDATGGSIVASDISGKSVSLDGDTVYMRGHVKAAGDINVRARTAPCPENISCSQALKGVTQDGNVISRNGSVMMSVGGGVTHNPTSGATTISDGSNGMISQKASSITRAGTNITLKAGYVRAGKNFAGDTITIDGSSAVLNGKLKAREIVLPADTMGRSAGIKPSTTEL